MAGGIDKGLSSSMWASAGGRSYLFRAETQIQTTQTSERLSYPSATTPCTPSTLSTPSPAAEVHHHIDFHSALARVPTPWAELARHTKIVRRLKWKLPFLAYGYNAATNRASTDEQRSEAELMFKLDFFEYYMLIERALVHLLGVFGVKITGAFGTRQPGGRGNGDRREWEQSDHRFHANVLEALDDYRNPLHAALGKDNARSALARAKELRNRWKNADEPHALFAAKIGYRNSRPLEEYDLERTLETISAGFDHGFRIAEHYVAEVRAFAVDRGVSQNVDMDQQPDEWEFMTDAMDWEAV